MPRGHPDGGFCSAAHSMAPVSLSDTQHSKGPACQVLGDHMPPQYSLMLQTFLESALPQWTGLSLTPGTHLLLIWAERRTQRAHTSSFLPLWLCLLQPWLSGLIFQQARPKLITRFWRVKLSAGRKTTRAMCVTVNITVTRGKCKMLMKLISEYFLHFSRLKHADQYETGSGFFCFLIF